LARDAPVIEAFGAGGFRLSGVRYEGSVLILQDEARPWPVTDLADLALADFEPVLAAGTAEVEFVLLGVGPRNALPPRAVRDGLKAAGIGCEFMDTPGAARLYNYLTSEGRRVAAALIAV
jgi:uncharacterized protein